MKNNSLKLTIFLMALIGIWLISVVLHTTLVWFFVVNVIAIYIICRYRAFNKTDIVMGLLFGILCIPSSVIMGGAVILPYIAAMTIYKSHTNRILLFKNDKRHTLVTTLTLIFIVGGILGSINVFFCDKQYACQFIF